MALPPCWNSWKSTSWLKNIFKNCKIAATEYPNTEENIGIYFCWISHYQAQLQEIWQHWCFCLHVPWLRWLVNVLSPRQPEFSPGSVRAGLMVNKVALAQVFLRVRWFPCTYHSTVPLHTHIFWGIKNRLVDGRNRHMKMNKDGDLIHVNTKQVNNNSNYGVDKIA